MWSKKSRGDKVFDIVLISISLLIILVIAYPLYFVIIASFSQPEAVLGGKLRLLPVGFNLESYKMVLTERKVWVGYRNTLLYTVFGTFINLVLTTLAAAASLSAASLEAATEEAASLEAAEDAVEDALLEQPVMATASTAAVSARPRVRLILM